MARPKKQLNRREDILSTAQILFTEKGFEKTTIDEIARHIGIGKGTVYLDFKNKDDILKAIIERYAMRMLDQQELLIKDAKPPYLELLRKITQKQVLDVFDMSTSQVHTHIALMHTSYQFKNELKHVKERGVNIITSLLKASEKNGEIQSIMDPRQVAYLIIVLMQGFFPPYDLKYSPDHRTDLTKQEIRKLLSDDSAVVLELILSGLKIANYSGINVGKFL